MTTLVTRKEWGARPRGTGTTQINPTEGVTVHYEGSGWSWPWDHSTCDDKVRSMQADHMDSRGWSDIAYNYLACPHNYLYEGRGYDRRSSANGTEHANAVSFAVQGIWGDKSGKPPNDLLRAIRFGIDLLRRKGGASNKLHGHRDWKSTSCPGSYLYSWVQKGCPNPDLIVNPPKPPAPTFEDGLTMALSQEALNQINEIVENNNDRVLRFLLQTSDEQNEAREMYDKARSEGKTPVEARKIVANYIAPLIENV